MGERIGSLRDAAGLENRSLGSDTGVGHGRRVAIGGEDFEPPVGDLLIARVIVDIEIAGEAAPALCLERVQVGR